MARPWLRWLSRIGIAVAVIAVLAVPWAVWWLWSRLAPQLDPRTIIAIVIGALALLATIWWVWWRLPERQAARLRLWETKARADVEDNFRKTVGQALGGAAVLIGAVAAYLQFTQQQQASRDLLISNQVAKGFEQLAGDKIAMRLGGVYALEGVMNTSEQYHEPVLEALCAFVRESTTRHPVTLTTFLAALFPAAHDKTVGNGNDAPATDVQAALTVIGRRTNPELGFVDLRRANIPGANFNRAHLAGAFLYEAHLEDANLIEAHLERAFLRGAHLERAFLIEAHLEGADLAAAHLERADLGKADGLTQAEIDRAYGDAATRLPAGLTRPADWTAATGGGAAPAPALSGSPPEAVPDLP